MSPHDFQESLKRSHEAEDLSLWKEVYTRAFPTMQTMLNHREDGQHQRNGIDRSVILDNGKQIWIDEKVRGRNQKTNKVYSDIALEYWSDERRQIPGWVCKPLLCDYIAYAITPLGRCHLLPVLELQAAWKKKSKSWIRKYPKIRAENKGWITVSVGVPPEEIYKELYYWKQIPFKAFELNNEINPNAA